MSDPIDVVRQRKREDAMKREFLIAPDPSSCDDDPTKQNRHSFFSPHKMGSTGLLFLEQGGPS